MILNICGNVLNVGNVFQSSFKTTFHVEQSELIPRCLNCYPINYGCSCKELELADFCKHYFSNIIQHDRQLIKPFELDIVIPELHLAFEFNGIFWHSITIRNTSKLSFNEN